MVSQGQAPRPTLEEMGRGACPCVYGEGKFPRQIFEDAGFDIEIVGIERAKSALKRWRAAYRENGLEGLEDSRKYSSGRPLEREFSIEEKYARLEAQNALLRAENELLKKIDLAERLLVKKKLNINDLNNFIKSKKPDVERIIVRDRKSERIVRMRKRDIDEQKILDLLCIKRWEKAEKGGKVKYITERKWYYEFD